MLSPDEVNTLNVINNRDPYVLIYNFECNLGGEARKEAENIEIVDDCTDRRHNVLLPALISMDKSLNRDLRGDYHMWLSPNSEFRNITALVKKIISSISPYLTAIGLDADYSVQLTYYPGSGARYVRHVDTLVASNRYRKLTLVYYLNEEIDGGFLRIFQKDKSFLDVSPSLGNLVLFRSDIVEHEVLPCWKPRWAISMWIYSRRDNMLSLYDYPRYFEPPSIFVSIAAYRDSECKHTVNDIYRKARYPNKIHVGILWLRDCDGKDGPPVAFSELLNIFPTVDDVLQNIQVLEMDYRQARGPMKSRHIVESLYRNEDYILQIDSHMRFLEEWDEFLVSQLQLAREQYSCSLPILTGYPLPYELPDEIPSDSRSTILQPSFFDSDGILRSRGVPCLDPILSSTSEFHCPMRSLLWAAGFSFSLGNLFSRAPYPSFLDDVFFGEEIYMAAQYYCRGYDFFTPSRNVVYHLWSREHRPTFQESFTPERLTKRAQNIQYIVDYLAQRLPTEVYHHSLGSSRSLSDFENYIGVDFRNQIVHSRIDINTIFHMAPSILQYSSIEKRDSSNTKDFQSKRNQVQSVVSLVNSFL